MRNPIAGLAAIALSLFICATSLGQGADKKPVLMRCELHQIALKDGHADIRYGLMPPEFFNSPYMRAEKQHFPQANTFVLGGCVVTERKKQEVKFCPPCRTAEAKWRKANPPKK